MVNVTLKLLTIYAYLKAGDENEDPEGGKQATIASTSTVTTAWHVCWYFILNGADKCSRGWRKSNCGVEDLSPNDVRHVVCLAQIHIRLSPY